MARTDPQFNLRIPESLRDLVVASAKRNKRSATAEILDRLERSFTNVDEMGISDRDRMDPKHAFYSPESGRQITTKVHKERLLSGLEGPLNAQEEKIMSAMIKALRGIGEFEEEETVKPNRGPKPRKRYQKV